MSINGIDFVWGSSGGTVVRHTPLDFEVAYSRRSVEGIAIVVRHPTNKAASSNAPEVCPLAGARH
jgi:hypothetical protein